MQYSVETSEGTDSLTESGMTQTQFEATLDMMVRLKMVDAIPNLVNQVRISEELYAQRRDQNSSWLAQACAKAARELLEIKYGPIPGVMLTPPVSKGRWNW